MVNHQRFLSPGAIVDPSIGDPLMLAFNSSHARVAGVNR